MATSQQRLHALALHLSSTRTLGRVSDSRTAAPVPAASSTAAAPVGPLSAAQVAQFHEDGFVVVDGLLSVEDNLNPIRQVACPNLR